MIDDENAWELSLQIKTNGRDELNADECRFPYEPTPYCVLERLADSGFFGKNDKLIFEKLARFQPSVSVMVGDRLDNDIRPAKELGMKTVWIRMGLSRYQPVDLGKTAADWIIDNLSNLKEVFE